MFKYGARHSLQCEACQKYDLQEHQEQLNFINKYHQHQTYQTSEKINNMNIINKCSVGRNPEGLPTLLKVRQGSVASMVAIAQPRWAPPSLQSRKQMESQGVQETNGKIMRKLAPSYYNHAQKSSTKLLTQQRL